MFRHLDRFIVIAFLFAVLIKPSAGKEPLVFISAFAKGEQGAIHAYNLVKGKLKLIHRTIDVEHPFFMAVTRDNKYLYSIHAKQFGGKKNEQIAAYKILGRTGKLRLLNRQSALGTAACYLDVDSSGKTVLVANYATGSVASLPIRKDGSLGPASSFVQHKGGSNVDKSRQMAAHAHCFVISPDNRFAFAADLGLDQVLAYRLNSEKAKLSANAQPFVRTPPGAGPRHLTFHPGGKAMYVINELANSVTHFSYSPDSGLLIERQTISTLPKDFKGTSYCADLKITPNGRFLYGTNRGHHSVAAYRIRDDGSLAGIGIFPSLGEGPQNLAITANGKSLICANMPSSNVAVFHIDGKTGALKSAGKPISIPSPSCIMIR